MKEEFVTAELIYLLKYNSSKLFFLFSGCRRIYHGSMAISLSSFLKKTYLFCSSCVIIILSHHLLCKLSSCTKSFFGFFYHSFNARWQFSCWTLLACTFFFLLIPLLRPLSHLHTCFNFSNIPLIQTSYDIMLEITKGEDGKGSMVEINIFHITYITLLREEMIWDLDLNTILNIFILVKG